MTSEEFEEKIREAMSFVEYIRSYCLEERAYDFETEGPKARLIVETFACVGDYEFNLEAIGDDVVIRIDDSETTLYLESESIYACMWHEAETRLRKERMWREAQAAIRK